MSDWITFALPKGRIMQDTMALLEQIGITCPEMAEESRKLVFENREDRYRFMAVRATDVPTYVEYGCADLGVVGKDTLLEQGKDLYEPLDLKFGYCRLVVAEPKDLGEDDDPLSWSRRREEAPEVSGERGGDTRTARSEEPQYQNEADRAAAAQTDHATHCRTCLGLP